MSRCPVGENCTGCQYAEHCAHPEVQAERLRADVKQPSRRRRKLTRERDAARFDAARMTQENERLRAEIERALREGRIEGIKEALNALNPIPPRGDADRWGAGFRSAYETIAAFLARAEEVERE